MQLWDAERYDRFEAERARPSRELIARIPLRNPRRIVDLGCGSGLSTLELRRAFPESEIVGVDLSPDMLKAAAKKLPDATFLEGDAGRFDARGLRSRLRQCGVSLGSRPSRRHCAPGRRIAGRRRARLPDARQRGGAEPPADARHRGQPAFRGSAGAAARGRRSARFADYDAALSPPCDEVDLWRTTYVHRLGAPEDVVKWVEGSGLRPYLDPLDRRRRASFLAAYGASRGGGLSGAA